MTDKICIIARDNQVMDLLVITPEKNGENETRLVNHLFAGGLERLHLRKPIFSDYDYRVYLKEIDPFFYSRVVIHGSYHLMDELNLGGIHLNSEARNDPGAWDKVKHLAPGLISTSFHAWKEIEANDFPYRYVFISPVFESISKVGYRANIDLNGAIKMKKKLTNAGRYCPGIIGLGGVDSDGIRVLRELGFDGAALLGFIWNSIDPAAAFKLCMGNL